MKTIVVDRGKDMRPITSLRGDVLDDTRIPLLIVDGYEDAVLMDMSFREAFAQLNNNQKVVIGLNLQGYLNKDIAKIIGLSPSGTSYHKRTAIKKLKRIMTRGEERDVKFI